jgi:flagellar basal-body rod protein FlgF
MPKLGKSVFSALHDAAREQIGTRSKTERDIGSHFGSTHLIDPLSMCITKRLADCIHFVVMDPLLISAASGMKARMESLDMLANNIANTGTVGFKADREFYGLYEQQLPVLERQWTDFSQGTLTATGNPLNLALSGNGMFALNSPGGVVYTRNGNFQVSKTNQLTTPDGYTLRNTLDQGKPIAVDPLQPIEISKDGIVRQAGQDIAKIEIDSPESQALSKLGSTYFAMTDPKTPVPSSQNTDVLQGQVEQSNVPVADSAVKLVSIMRQFEMLQKALTLAGEMSKQAIDQVAKVV